MEDCEDDGGDLYEDLPNFRFDETIDELNATISTLEVKNNELHAMLGQVKEEKDVLQTSWSILSTNISSLLKTAKLEIQRKNRTIDDLREQLNNAKTGRVFGVRRRTVNDQRDAEARKERVKSTSKSRYTHERRDESRNYSKNESKSVVCKDSVRSSKTISPERQQKKESDTKTTVRMNEEASSWSKSVTIAKPPAIECPTVFSMRMYKKIYNNDCIGKVNKSSSRDSDISNQPAGQQFVKRILDGKEGCNEISTTDITTDKEVESQQNRVVLKSNDEAKSTVTNVMDSKPLVENVVPCNEINGNSPPVKRDIVINPSVGCSVSHDSFKTPHKSLNPRSINGTESIHFDGPKHKTISNKSSNEKSLLQISNVQNRQSNLNLPLIKQDDRLVDLKRSSPAVCSKTTGDMEIISTLPQNTLSESKSIEGTESNGRLFGGSTFDKLESNLSTKPVLCPRDNDQGNPVSPHPQVSTTNLTENVLNKMPCPENDSKGIFKGPQLITRNGTVIKDKLKANSSVLFDGKLKSGGKSMFAPISRQWGCCQSSSLIRTDNSDGSKLDSTVVPSKLNSLTSELSITINNVNVENENERLLNAVFGSPLKWADDVSSDSSKAGELLKVDRRTTMYNIFGSPLKGVDSGSSQPPLQLTVPAAAYEDSCTNQFKKSDTVSNNINSSVGTNENIRVSPTDKLNSSVNCNPNENAHVGVNESTNNDIVLRPPAQPVSKKVPSIFSPIKDSKSSLHSAHLDDKSTLGLFFPFKTEKKYEDSVLGQFDDTAQFVSALAKMESKISPLSTPMKSIDLSGDSLTLSAINHPTSFKEAFQGGSLQDEGFTSIAKSQEPIQSFISEATKSSKIEPTNEKHNCTVKIPETTSHGVSVPSVTAISEESRKNNNYCSDANKTMKQEPPKGNISSPVNSCTPAKFIHRSNFASSSVFTVNSNSQSSFSNKPVNILQPRKEPRCVKKKSNPISSNGIVKDMKLNPKIAIDDAFIIEQEERVRQWQMDSLHETDSPMHSSSPGTSTVNKVITPRKISKKFVNSPHKNYWRVQLKQPNCVNSEASPEESKTNTESTNTQNTVNMIISTAKINTSEKKIPICEEKSTITPPSAAKQNCGSSTIPTFSRAIEGSLYMGGKQVTSAWNNVVSRIQCGKIRDNCIKQPVIKRNSNFKRSSLFKKTIICKSRMNSKSQKILKFTPALFEGPPDRSSKPPIPSIQSDVTFSNHNSSKIMTPSTVSHLSTSKRTSPNSKDVIVPKHKILIRRKSESGFQNSPGSNDISLNSISPSLVCNTLTHTIGQLSGEQKYQWILHPIDIDLSENIYENVPTLSDVDPRKLRRTETKKQNGDEQSKETMVNGTRQCVIPEKFKIDSNLSEPSINSTPKTASMPERIRSSSPSVIDRLQPATSASLSVCDQDIMPTKRRRENSLNSSSNISSGTSKNTGPRILAAIIDSNGGSKKCGTSMVLRNSGLRATHREASRKRVSNASVSRSYHNVPHIHSSSPNENRTNSTEVGGANLTCAISSPQVNDAFVGKTPCEIIRPKVIRVNRRVVDFGTVSTVHTAKVILPGKRPACFGSSD